MLLSLLLFSLSPPCAGPPMTLWAGSRPLSPLHLSPLHLPGWRPGVPGVVTVRSGVVIDREAFSPPVLELLLLAEDIGLLNGTADLIVTILDDNDNWPTFSPAALTIHLLENCPPGEQGAGRRPAPGRSWLVVRGGWSLTGRGGQAAGWGERALEREPGVPGPTHFLSLIHGVWSAKWNC